MKKGVRPIPAMGVKALLPVTLYLSKARIIRLAQVAAENEMSVSRYVSEVIDVALSDRVAAVREESCYVSSALLAVEQHPY